MYVFQSNIKFFIFWNMRWLISYHFQFALFHPQTENFRNTNTVKLKQQLSGDKDTYAPFECRGGGAINDNMKLFDINRLRPIYYFVCSTCRKPLYGKRKRLIRLLLLRLSTITKRCSMAANESIWSTRSKTGDYIQMMLFTFTFRIPWLSES